MRFTSTITTTTAATTSFITVLQLPPPYHTTHSAAHHPPTHQQYHLSHPLPSTSLLSTMSLPSLLSLLLLVLLSLSSSPLLTSAQPPAPTLITAVDIIVGTSTQLYLQWTVPSGCPTGTFGCHFTLYHDAVTLGSPWAPSPSTNCRTSGRCRTSAATPPATTRSGSRRTPSTPPTPSRPTTSPCTSTHPPPPPPPPNSPNANAPGIVGDPQFTGLRGQTYQVHGMPNEVFNIVSDTDFNYNSRFVYLTAGACPTHPITGRKLDTPCFTHPGDVPG